jgi:hypothetical protein
MSAFAEPFGEPVHAESLAHDFSRSDPMAVSEYALAPLFLLLTVAGLPVARPHRATS